MVLTVRSQISLTFSCKVNRVKSNGTQNEYILYLASESSQFFKHITSFFSGAS